MSLRSSTTHGPNGVPMLQDDKKVRVITPPCFAVATLSCPTRSLEWGRNRTVDSWRWFKGLRQTNYYFYFFYFVASSHFMLQGFCIRDLFFFWGGGGVTPKKMRKQVKLKILKNNKKVHQQETSLSRNTASDLTSDSFYWFLSARQIASQFCNCNVLLI